MEPLTFFSLGFLAATTVATGVVYYLSRRYLNVSGLFKLLNQREPHLTHFPGADLIEYNHLGSNYGTLVPTDLDELFSSRSYRLRITFNDGSKAKFELVPGQWLPGRFVDYHIQRLSVRPISIVDENLDPVEVFDAEVDDGQAPIWPTIHRRVAAECDDDRNTSSSCSCSDSTCDCNGSREGGGDLDIGKVVGSFVSTAMTIAKDDTAGDEPNIGEVFGSLVNTMLSTTGPKRVKTE